LVNVRGKELSSLLLRLGTLRNHAGQAREIAAGLKDGDARHGFEAYAQDLEREASQLGARVAAIRQARKRRFRLAPAYPRWLRMF